MNDDRTSNWFAFVVVVVIIGVISFGVWRIIFLGHVPSHRYPTYYPFLLGGFAIWYAVSGVFKGRFGAKADLDRNRMRFWIIFALMSVFGIEMLAVGFAIAGR